MTERKPRSLLFVSIGWGLLGTLLGGGAVEVICTVVGVAGAGATTDTPLKVRGGSMTVFTNIDKGWEDSKGGMATSLPYCVPIKDTSYIETDGFLDHDGSMIGSTTLNPDAGDWTLTVASHNAVDLQSAKGPHMGNVPSAEGITFQARNFGCDGKDTTLQSILISVFDGAGGTKTGQYAVPLPNKAATYKGQNPRKASFRFFDNVLGASDPGDRTGAKDQEYQERMSEIKMLYKVSGKSKMIDYVCPDGDCSIGLGKAQ